MVTRRTLLAVTGASVLAGCRAGETEFTDLVYVTTAAGVSVFDGSGRLVTPATPVVAATPGWRQVVTARAEGAGTRVEVQDLAARQVLSSYPLRDRVEPRIVSATGDLVASVTPGGAGIYGLHEPGGRDRTTLVVSRRDGERVRLDLPGNLEPDAFSPDGGRLFVLDYVPADQPQRYRSRVVDLATGQLAALSSRAGGPIRDGAEPLTRAHRIEGVLDRRRDRYFTLYAYQPDAVAFVDCLDLRERWSYRVPLPAPFGRERPGTHAIVLADAGDRLCVVHAPSASVADIDPDQLVVTRVTSFAGTGQPGKPSARITAAGRLLVGTDRMVFASEPYREIPTPGEARGLALGTRDDIWVGHPQGTVRYDLASGAEIGRIAVPDLYVVKHVRAAR